METMFWITMAIIGLFVAFKLVTLIRRDNNPYHEPNCSAQDVVSYIPTPTRSRRRPQQEVGPSSNNNSPLDPGSPLSLLIIDYADEPPRGIPDRPDDYGSTPVEPDYSFTPDPTPAYEVSSHESSNQDFSGGSSDGGGATGDW